MLSRLWSRIKSAASPARRRWAELGRRRQFAVAAAAALLVSGGVAVAVVLAVIGGGEPFRCVDPICVEVIGPKGDAVHPMTPVQIKVLGEGDREALVQALQISNEPLGTKASEKDVLTFRPQWPGFARGVTYQVALSLPRSALPVGAKPVDVKFSFTTDGKLEISSLFPPDEAQEIALDAMVMVQFNRSVASLTVIDARGAEGIIEFDPPIEGKGRWLNTSLYTFVPAGAGWAPATRYSARVKAGLANQLGATLDADYVFSFSTLSPGVSSVFPPDNSKFVAPQPEVKVVFNQPVDRASAQAALGLAPKGTAAFVAGTYDWADDYTMAFRPSRSLALSTAYEGVVRPGVKAFSAEATMAAEVRWIFNTVGVPQVVSTEPSSGSTSANQYGVSIRFSNPMDEKSVEDNIAISPKLEEDPLFSWDQDGTQVFVGVSLQPSSPYRVTLSTAAKDRYGQPLASALDLSFVTAPLQPGFSIFRSSRSGSFNAYLEPRISVSSWNVSVVNFELYRIGREGLIQWEQQDQYLPPSSGLVRQWSESIAGPPLNEAVVTTTRLAEGGGPLPQGVYFLRVNAPGVPGFQDMPLVVSSANVVTKWTERELLVWLVDMKTGAAIGSLPLEVLDRTGGVVASAKTGSDGVARIELPKSPGQDYFQGFYVYAASRGVTVLSGTAWSDGINPWNFNPNIQFVFAPPRLVGYLYTDRPIYRPIETVYFKGVVRADDDARYSLPLDASLTMQVHDPQGRLVDSRSVRLSDMGTFNRELALSSEAPTGVYFVTLTEGVPTPEKNIPPVAQVSFRVAEFRKPEFEVTVATDKDSFTNGETVNATVSAQLFFGAPLAGADVKWQATSDPFFFEDEEYPGYSFTDFQPVFDFTEGPFFEPQQFVRGEGAGTTDASGTLSFSVPGDVSSDPVSQAFVVEATVTDQNGQSVGSFTGTVVHKGQFYLGLRPEAYVAVAGSASRVSLVSIDPEGRAVANQTATVTVYERKWRTVRERDASGQLRYRSESEDTVVQTISARTGADGKGTFSFTPPKSGQYYVVAEARDRAGNTVRSSVFIWATSPQYATWRIGNDDLMELVADKTEYKPGETARILVASPFSGGRGLITQERGRILSYGLRDFVTNSDVLEVPITSDHIPTVYIGVTLFKPPTADNPMPQVRFGLVTLKVSADEKELRISIEPGKERYEPRETVTYRIRTTDSAGKGMPAEVSLALVDKSVLSLQDEFAEPALKAFWHERALGVLAASSFAASIDRANELARAQQEGGGKGGGGGEGEQTRTFFPNTAYWEPTLRTGRDGTAEVEVALPDTLTTWRLTARGVTSDTKAGEARNEIVTSKELIVRPVVPRFLVADDHAFLGAIVHNFTGSVQEVSVTLTAEGLTVEGDATQSVKVEPGNDALVRWGTRAPAGRDDVTVTFDARDGGRSDTVQLKLPLYGFFTPETVGTAGEVRDEASEAVEVPYWVRPDAGELTVRVSPSLAAGVNSAINYLREYPYESAELTVSRMVSVLALRRAIEELELTDIDDGGKDVTALTQRSLQRLYNHQHADGGWGWWVDDESDPAISAYVVIGLAEAKRAGFEIDQRVEEQASTYLLGELDKQRDVLRPEMDLRAYILYALARLGHGDLGRSFALAERGEELSNTAKAWVALDIKLSGGDEKDPRLTALITDLQTAAIPSATGNHWEEGEYNLNIFGNSVQTTAQVLQAFTELAPDHPLVDGTLRWLMVARKEGHWESPHDTTVALLAITDFMIVHKDVQAAFDYRVEFNGETRLSGKAEKGKVHQEEKLVIQMSEILKETVNQLKLTRSPASAAGRLYYTAHLRYFAPAENVEAVNRGIGVSHEYFRADVDTETPVRQVKLGDLVMVKVTLVAESDLNFLVLEDYLPAGLEPIDASLKTTPPELRRRLYEEQQNAYQVSRRWSPFGHVDVRDNRVVLFARFVPKGVYEYTYFAQATTPGEFKVAPATAYEQYFPEVWGRSDGGGFTVEGEEASAGASHP